jgi:hypothetical protein
MKNKLIEGKRTFLYCSALSVNVEIKFKNNIYHVNCETDYYK